MSGLLWVEEMCDDGEGNLFVGICIHSWMLVVIDVDLIKRTSSLGCWWCSDGRVILIGKGKE